jgi:ribosome biogenesis protein Nip4
LCQVEDTKRALFLYGNDVSQTVKEAMTDLHKLKGVRQLLQGAEQLLLKGVG